LSESVVREAFYDTNLCFRRKINFNLELKLKLRISKASRKSRPLLIPC